MLLEKDALGLASLMMYLLGFLSGLCVAVIIWLGKTPPAINTKETRPQGPDA